MFATAFLGISSLFTVSQKCYKGVLASYVIFMMLMAGFGTKLFYDLDYKFGQDDLMKFAKQIKADNNDLYVINNGRKYSILYYYDGKVKYLSTRESDGKVSCPPTHKSDEKVSYLSAEQSNDGYSNAPNGIFSKDARTIVKRSDYIWLRRFYDMDVVLTGRKYLLIRMKSVKRKYQIL